MSLSPLRLRTTIAVMLINLCFIQTLLAQVPAGRKITPLEMAEKALSSVVSLTGKDFYGKPVAAGSGFFVKDNLIATDYNVVRNAIKIEAKLPGQEAKEAVIVGVDSRRVVALLQVDGIKGTPLARGLSNRVEVGSEVVVLSNSGADEEGVMSNTTISEIRAAEGKLYFKLSTKLPQSSRGGAVVDNFGQVLCIAVAGPAGEKDNRFAIPSSYLTSVLLSGEERPPDIPNDEPPKSPGTIIGGVAGGASGPEKPKDAPAPPPPPPSSPPDTVVKSSRRPSVIRRAQPLYPPLAKAARITGTVTVEVTVDEEGDIFSARIISGHPLLKEASLNAARAWKFTPTLFDGKPVAVIGHLTFTFSL
ncbi:MAG: TonB family protein [Blastocatellia bacterium]|nr:TonB family protein [Blastocatellia bacterium]